MVLQASIEAKVLKNCLLAWFWFQLQRQNFWSLQLQLWSHFSVISVAISLNL